jgi:hypothetical protein
MGQSPPKAIVKETNMRLVHSLLLAGAAVAGLAILAPSMAGEIHRLNIALPGGGMETIEYSGTVAPRVTFQPRMVSFADPWAESFWPAGFGVPSFAAFDRIAAEMDAQMNAMMRQAELLTRLPQDRQLSQAVLNQLPAGTTSFSIVSRSTGNGVCTHVTRITRGSNDVKPQVVSEVSGDCGAGGRHAVSPGVSSDIRQINYLSPAGTAVGGRL